MSRSSSATTIVQNGDVAPPWTPQHVHKPSLLQRTTINESRRTASISKAVHEGAAPDPDELFTKHTISEVKAIQTRLRADADAKQEELRLMVGERYRDLLQASTSIIAISQSSKRVLQDLEEAKAEIQAQEPPPVSQETSVRSDDDLHALQLLSAHLKLLLDAPEHLWRLLERKKYFSAAWLFLLSRVVHQALLQNDDEETWSRSGIDVMAQFPLIQRQWEVVAQFRSQIIHKAALHLRLHDASDEDTCATLLTLHLLDARPLTDTFVTLLSQRSRTLQTMLSRNPREISRPGTPSTPTTSNGVTTDTKGAGARSVQEVRDAVLAALQLIAHTVISARRIYRGDATSLGLALRVLQFIQSDSHETSDLPADLSLTTQSLLATLPSSTHFQLLPPTLRAYKPYVDLSSSSSTVSQDDFTQRLDAWFRTSCKNIKTAIERWFADLETVKEVWGVRKAILKWIAGESGLEGGEATHIESVFDDLCRRRLVGIWKAAFLDAERTFERQLTAAVSTLKTGGEPTIDSSPLEFLFQAPPLPAVAQMGSTHGDGLFHKYRTSLRYQLLGRTTLLNDVLSALEDCARTLQQSFAHITGHASDTDARLLDELRSTCRPDAEALCTDVLRVMASLVEDSGELTDSSIQSLLFVGRLAENLNTGSSFVGDMSCSDEYREDFRVKARDLHESIVDRWRLYTVDRVIRQHKLHEPSVAGTSTAAFSPSFALVNALCELSNAVQQLGIHRDQTRQQRLAGDTLRLFLQHLATDQWKSDGFQALCDAGFLRALIGLWGPDWSDVASILDDKIQQLIPQGEIRDVAELERSATAYLARVQVLLAGLLPAREGAKGELLRYGTPAVGQEFQPALELAKPGARFGLLLVGGAGGAV
ncbi:Vps51/Vps67 domain-containing protein [Schizophyllum commune Tattone D]|nr:Vps51/Vps67 domain-containing protein [Schizophyllum commune Tattone D]